MKLFIFSTNINTQQKVKSVHQLFNNDQNIIDFSVDIEDIDNVLRIETTDIINESDIIDRVKNKGFNCVELAD